MSDLLVLATVLASFSGSAFAQAPPDQDAEPPSSAPAEDAKPVPVTASAPAPDPSPAPVAAPAPEPEPPPVVLSAGEFPGQRALRHHSVNISPLGELIGITSLNYEYLIDGYHALLLGMTSYEPNNWGAREEADKVIEESGGLSLGYRYHFSGKQQSWFAGFNVGTLSGFKDHEVDTSVTVNGVTEEGETVIRVDHSGFEATANFGYRWQWDSGFNMTIRIGKGFATATFTTRDDSPDAQLAVDQAKDDLLGADSSVEDGEFSLGWTF